MNCKKWEVYSRIEKTMTDCSRLILPLSQVTTKYALFSYYFYEKFMNHAKLPQKFFKNWRNISLKWKKSIENEFTHLKFKWSQLNSRSEIHDRNSTIRISWELRKNFALMEEEFTILQKFQLEFSRNFDRKKVADFAYRVLAMCTIFNIDKWLVSLLNNLILFMTRS